VSMEEKDERPSESEDASKTADEIVRSVREDKSADDGLTKRERSIEESKHAERIRKAKELRKQLRKKELGLVKYRWSALVLLLGGVLSIWSEFLVTMVHPAGIGIDSFADAFALFGDVFFLFPALAGGIMVVCGIFAYTNPKATLVSLIPGMMIAMSGGEIYFLVSFALAADPNAGVWATGTPLTMLLTAALCLLAVFLRERE